MQFVDSTSNKPRYRIVARGLTPKRILIANSKGGCGKSTIATNLACYYAHHNKPTTLIDMDEQGSSSFWLERRPEQLPLIHGIEAFRQPASGTTQNWYMRTPRDTQRIIIDSPAGFSGTQLKEQVSSADILIIPVLPSPIDIHATMRFIQCIYMTGYFDDNSNKQLLVLGNRVRANTVQFRKLNHFLSGLDLPIVTSIRDTQNYVRATARGLGIFDLPLSLAEKDQSEWRRIINVIEHHLHGVAAKEAQTNYLGA